MFDYTLVLLLISGVIVEAIALWIVGFHVFHVEKANIQSAFGIANIMIVINIIVEFAMGNLQPLNLIIHIAGETFLVRQFFSTTWEKALGATIITYVIGFVFGMIIALI